MFLCRWPENLTVYLTRLGDVSTVRFLLESCWDLKVDAVTNEGNGPLHMAAKCNEDVQILEVLLEDGLDRCDGDREEYKRFGRASAARFTV